MQQYVRDPAGLDVRVVEEYQWASEVRHAKIAKIAAAKSPVAKHNKLVERLERWERKMKIAARRIAAIRRKIKYYDRKLVAAPVPASQKKEVV